MRPENFDQMIRRLTLEQPFFRLMRPIGGVAMPPLKISQKDISVPEFSVFSSGLGYLTMTYPNIANVHGHVVNNLGGAGSDELPELAIVRSVAEAAERYATCVYSENAAIYGSANELGSAALDLDTLPRCSALELADSKCPVQNPQKNKPIRWIKGVSLTKNCAPVYVPLVLTHLYVRPMEAENFNYPISTGIAVHTSLAKALVAAINEVVERDAIAITWLAKLPLSKIKFDCDIPAEHAQKFKRQEGSLLKSLFFNATSDVGVPTVYSVGVLDAHPNVTRFVSCSAEFDVFEACSKVIREAAAGRTMFEDGITLPENFQDFMSLSDGTAYMGRPENKKGFDFLTETDKNCDASILKERYKDLERLDDEQKLKWLIDRFKLLGMDVAAVDLSTDELKSVGLYAVRVVIPQLMPMSTFYRARFLAHPRLYEYPKWAGFGAFSEADVNQYPQPFA